MEGTQSERRNWVDSIWDRCIDGRCINKRNQSSQFTLHLDSFVVDNVVSSLLILYSNTVLISTILYSRAQRYGINAYYGLHD